jgi:Tfp pilus assembly protein PilO
VNRRVILFAVVAAVIVLAGWYLLLWSPTKSDLDKAKERRAAAESQQSQLRSEIQRLQEAQRNEPANRAKLERLRTAIPDDPSLGQFIIDVNDAATRSGIDFISIAPTEPHTAARAPVVTTTTVAGSTPTTSNAPLASTTPGAAPAEIGLTLQIQGGYFQVLDFLNRLDSLPRLVVTDSLNISPGENVRLTVAISARMFVRDIPAGFAGGVATTTSTTAAGAGGSTTTTAAGGATSTAPSSATTSTTARP